MPECKDYRLDHKIQVNDIKRTSTSINAKRMRCSTMFLKSNTSQLDKLLNLLILGNNNFKDFNEI